jgi:Superinfection immunity protein
MGILVIASLAFVAAVIYLAPALIAHARHLPAEQRIMAFDLLLGWTVIGWAAALRAACQPSGHGLPSSGADSQVRRCHQTAQAVLSQTPASPPQLRSGHDPGSGFISVWHSLN